MAEVCAAFGCSPDVAERQPWWLTRAVLDYRNAREAVRLFGAGDEGRKQLMEQRHLTDLLLEMSRAQGAPIDLEAGGESGERG